ncbi:MAG: NAD-binding protein [Micrococcaceae bacterium]|nr:NAD-binding protein [Micrococcaceae bacterium]
MFYPSTEPSEAQQPKNRRRFRLMLLLAAGSIAMVALYSGIFLLLMDREGQSHDWTSALYWTVTTMSTLGYGDITFDSDAGRLFSMVVLVSGMLLLLVVLPFMFIQFVVTPWMEERDKAQVARKVPDDLNGHILLVGIGPVTQTLIARAKRTKIPTLVLVDDPSEAVRLKDEGYQTMVGPLDSPITYRRAGVDRAVMVVSTAADTTNTNVAFTVRAVSKDVTITATADKKASVDVLELAGADLVIQLSSELGTGLANRVLGTTGRCHIIDSLGKTPVAEAAIQGTSLVGLTLDQAQHHIASRTKILAIMQRGRLLRLESDDQLTEGMVLIIAGSQHDLEQYDQQFQNPQSLEGPVLVLGGGRVGRAVAESFEKSHADYTIVEQSDARVPSHLEVTAGDAADLEILKSAGLNEASGVIITTHDDDLNVYLTLYCRRLQPDLQIITRATSEHNVATLYRAGADSVLSYASIGATAMWNKLGHSHRVVIAEGSELFTVPIPSTVATAQLKNERVYEMTGCHIVGALDAEQEVLVEADGVTAVQASQLILLGDRHAERKFRNMYLKTG